MHKSFYRKLILHSFISLIFLFSLSSVYSKEVNLKIRTNQFLENLKTLSVHDNPAELAFSSHSQINFSLLRFPATTGYVMFPSTIENSGNEAHSPAPYLSMVSSRASAIESVKYSTSLGQLGNIGFDLFLSHTGKFSRVNSEGKAVNEFPESDLVIASKYAKKFSNTGLGINAKFIRTKALDQEGEKTFVRGFVYDIGLIQKAGNFKFSLFWNNLSNGLSHPTNSSSASRFELKSSLHLGAAYHYVPLQDVELLFELDANPPFKHSIRGNIGTELRYRNWLNLRIGYLKDISDAFILADESDTDNTGYFTLDSLEEIEGLTFGIGLQISKLRLDLVCTPCYKLRAESDNSRLFMDDNNYRFSLSIKLL